MCSTWACAPSAISKQSARSTPKKLLRRLTETCIQGCCVQRHGGLSFLSPAYGHSPRSSAKYVAVGAFSPPKRAKKHRFPCLQTGSGCPPQTTDISEWTFFALLIYQFKGAHPGFLSCCLSTMYATLPRSETECLQNYCKIRRSSYDASQFSMQNSEVYMLHSFSSQVYSFQRRRQFLRENKSNICMFFV